MTNTTYYNLNIVEGTDIVNPLTVDNPNYEKIDEVMHDNAVSGVTMATEIANATVHAITRENSECAVIRFIATSEWKAGDTVTVDGVPVTALLPSGETLPDGAYVINANVLCILTGTNLTVYVERKKINDASDIKYNDTNVAAAITNLNTSLNAMNTLNLVYLQTPYFAQIPVLRTGKVCIISTSESTKQQLNDSSEIGTLPDSVKAAHWANISCVQASTGKTFRLAVNPENGKITYQGDNLEAGSWVSINGVWFTN